MDGQGHLEPFTIIEILANGRTKPQIEDEIEILLIQDNEVSVGILCYDEDENNTIYIDSPVNEEELNKDARAIIESQFPQYLQTDVATVMVAPPEIVVKMLW